VNEPDRARDIRFPPPAAIQAFEAAARLGSFDRASEELSIIRRLKEGGVTMLLVEQFAAAALEISDYGYVLENGRIAVHGPSAKLKSDPAVKAAYLGTAH